MPHSRRDEEDCIETLEAVRRIVNEGKKMGAEDFNIGGDINIELKMKTSGEDVQELDGVDWYGIYRPGCQGTSSRTRKIRWLQVLKDVIRTVTSTCGI